MRSPLNRRSVSVALGVVAAAALTPVLAPGVAHAAPTCTGTSTVSYASDWPTTMRMPSVGNETDQITCELGPNNNSSAVRTLQESLVTCYSQAIGIDGEFGTQTRNAVRAAQRRINQLHGAGLTVDGIYGPRTRKYFQWKLWDHNGNWAGCGYLGA
jgi:hypothetical protein